MVKPAANRTASPEPLPPEKPTGALFPPWWGDVLAPPSPEMAAMVAKVCGPKRDPVTLRLVKPEPEPDRGTPRLQQHRQAIVGFDAEGKPRDAARAENELGVAFAYGAILGPGLLACDRFLELEHFNAACIKAYATPPLGARSRAIRTGPNPDSIKRNKPIRRENLGQAIVDPRLKIKAAYHQLRRQELPPVRGKMVILAGRSGEDSPFALLTQSAESLPPELAQERDDRIRFNRDLYAHIIAELKSPKVAGAQLAYHEIMSLVVKNERPPWLAARIAGRIFNHQERLHWDAFLTGCERLIELLLEGKYTEEDLAAVTESPEMSRPGTKPKTPKTAEEAKAGDRRRARDARARRKVGVVSSRIETGPDYHAILIAEGFLDESQLPGQPNHNAEIMARAIQRFNARLVAEREKLIQETR